VFKDSALGLPPLNSNLAKKMLLQTKIYTALQGVRGMKGVDMDALIDIMVRFSVLVVDHPEIAECDINPLVASSNGILALDARVLLHDRVVRELPTPAIRPYPHQYAFAHEVASGVATVRPVLPQDEERMLGFYSQAAWPDGLDPTAPVSDEPLDVCRLPSSATSPADRRAGATSSTRASPTTTGPSCWSSSRRCRAKRSSPPPGVARRSTCRRI